jgi:two-component system NtrC family sensor kinase
MSGDFQISAIILIAALMLAFGYLHMRFRSVRTMLWILALICAELQAILLWLVDWQTQTFGPHVRSILMLNVASESALMLSSGFFLSSLSSLSFRIGNLRVLYVVPYVVPLLAYSALFYGTSQDHTASFFWVYCFLAFWAAAVALVWSIKGSTIPVYLALAIVISAGLICIPALLNGNVYWPLLVIESGNMLVTALLVIYRYRRISPGVVLVTCGFVAWALPPFFLIYGGQFPWVAGMTAIILSRAAIMGKVLVAIGLVLVVLEDEVQKNQTAQQRERRVRLELEAYARQALTARSLEDFDRGSSELCAMIVKHSEFKTAAMVVRSAAGTYALVGYAGMDGATAGALDTLAQRLPGNCFEADVTSLTSDGTSLDFDLRPWLTPGDELEALHLTRVGAVPMLGPDNSPEGALLLASSRVPLSSLKADDLLPLEILAGRLQAARSQAMMLGKLIDSERFAGVGQLATNVAQQLNNPLTVVLGYAALLEESTPAGDERRGAEAIAAEARKMKGILERLSRFSKLNTERFNSLSIADLITDIEQLHRTDLLKHSIEFRLEMQSELPNIFGNAHQIRQALLHAMQYCIESATRVEPNKEKSIRIEANVEDERVQIVIAHSGHGFPNPERAFDSLSSGFAATEATGIGLSLCAAIVREHRGNISAVNYQPSGAAVIIYLPVS